MSLGSVVALLLAARLDGGPESPFLILAVLPLMYVSLVLNPRTVSVVAAASLGGVVMVGVTDADIEASQQSILMFSAGLVGVSILAVASSVHRARLETDQAHMTERLRHLAATDPLTGCANQGSFHDRLSSEVDRARRYGRALSLLVTDVDLFKTFNDTYGHDRGDLLSETLHPACERL